VILKGGFMSKRILFIQGAGDGAYDEDAEVVESLRQELGPEYEITYPAMSNEADAPYEEWKQLIEKELAAMEGPVTLAGHSVGASVVVKYLSENKPAQPIDAVILMATPFWGGEGWLYEGYKELELAEGFAAKLPQGAPVFLYHCRDDSVVPFEHLGLYEKFIPGAVSRPLDAGGHQCVGGLGAVAQDIRGLELPAK
jgi:predicted alpha/beta hydrolase family esterase